MKLRAVPGELPRESVERCERELARARGDLERARADLDELAYAASHDLRAPLVSLSQIADTLEQEASGVLSQEALRHLAVLRRQINRFDGLLAGIGCYWRAGTSPSARRRAPRPVTLESAVAEASSDLVMPAGATVETVADCVIETDRAALVEVLRRLIDNALRHSGRGDVHVIVRGQQVDTGGWRVEVCDDGGGVPAGYRDDVWRLFFTLRPRTGNAGPGIGLAVVRRAVEERGGEVWISDAPGGGACVGFHWRER